VRSDTIPGSSKQNARPSSYDSSGPSKRRCIERGTAMPGVLAIQENAQDYDEGGKREENDGGPFIARIYALHDDEST
jgi:hypothetical protein